MRKSGSISPLLSKPAILTFSPAMNTGMEGHFIKNDIRLGRTKQRCPSTWEEGSLTATQIIEGKTSKKVMRSQKLILCKVEDDRRIWFEVAGLRDDPDVSIRFEAHRHPSVSI